MIETVVRLIQHCRDPAYRLAALVGEEELHVRVLEKGIFACVEKGFALQDERRDPEMITPIDAPRQLNKCPGIVRPSRANAYGTCRARRHSLPQYNTCNAAPAVSRDNMPSTIELLKRLQQH